jgi:protocatechuate 3,4-dioxygenase beta subunit
MSPSPLDPVSRRAFIGGSAAMAAGAVAAACGGGDDEPPAIAEPSGAASPPGVTATLAPSRSLAPTPACGDEDDITPEQTEGPFFTPDSPERRSLREPGIGGEPLTVSGFVLSTACEPVAGALLDFWQCDDAGEYDNEGYRLRGHQFAGDDGSFRLETIRPGLYPGRTRHIHVKVQAPGRPVLTTQLYFPGEPANATDGIFDPALVMDFDPADGQRASFTFVLQMG